MRVGRGSEEDFFKLCGSPIHTLATSNFDFTAYESKRAVLTPQMHSNDKGPRYHDAIISKGEDQLLHKHLCKLSKEYQGLQRSCFFSNWFASSSPNESLHSSLLDSEFNAQRYRLNSNDIALDTIIGEGAFGKVYKGLYKHQTVAVKLMIRQNLSSIVVREFEKEVDIMSRLQHPNICQLIGACLKPSTRALVLEYIELGSLWDYLRANRALSIHQRAQFLLDTARGMQYLHQFRPPILHRDLKTPNLLVEKHSLNIKIADFGLARVKEQIHTMTGNCGTTQWMAPEVLGNRKYTEKADVYSFGIVVWEVFTSQCPYDDMNQIQTALCVLNYDLRPPIPSKCPRFFSRLMRTCWRRDPELRPSFYRIVRTLEEKLNRSPSRQSRSIKHAMSSWEARVQSAILQIPSISSDGWAPARGDIHSQSHGPTRHRPNRVLKKAESGSNLGSTLRENDAAEIKRLRAMLLDRDRENCELYMQLSTYKKMLHQFTHRHQAAWSMSREPRRREGFIASAFANKRRHQEQNRMLELMTHEIERLRMQLILSEAERMQDKSESDVTGTHDTFQTQDEFFRESRTDELMELLSASHSFPDTPSDTVDKEQSKFSKSVSRFNFIKIGAELSRSSWKHKTQAIKQKSSSKWFFGRSTTSPHRHVSTPLDDPSDLWHQQIERTVPANVKQSSHTVGCIRLLDAKASETCIPDRYPKSPQPQPQPQPKTQTQTQTQPQIQTINGSSLIGSVIKLTNTLRVN
uniref:Protein kinase putative n=1 Tax=Albugo laibachii Nc14 TaxID=890382 RepID=F0WSU8_9STRA|nr:protein kinase putative [Albugo laibachii Nc14]|eukprot:CCA24426.1 protein kinase putative [Albugo laibachii Nc14]